MQSNLFGSCFGGKTEPAVQATHFCALVPVDIMMQTPLVEEL
jgi:hypothetical protein